MTAGTVGAAWLHGADANGVTLPGRSPVRHVDETLAYHVILCLSVIFPVSSSVYTYSAVCLGFLGVEN